MWLDLLFQGCMDAAQSEQVSRPVQVFCIILISFVFLIAISGLFLLVFVMEGQDLFRRGIFLVMGIIALAGYLQFLKAIVRRRRKKP